jgi:hypothetical protein
MFVTPSLFLVAASVIAAIPTETHERRACTTVQPASPNYLLLSQLPDSVVPYSLVGAQNQGPVAPNHQSGFAAKWKARDGVKFWNWLLLGIDSLIQFNNIPAGSYGCELHITFPPTYDFIANQASTQLNGGWHVCTIVSRDLYWTHNLQFIQSLRH